MRKTLLAIAAVGAVAAGCTNAPARESGQAAPVVSTPGAPECPAYGYGKECAGISDFDQWFKVGWVQVGGPFEQSPDGLACSVPNFQGMVNEGPQPDLSRAMTDIFTVTPVYEKYRWGEHNENEDTRQAGVAFTDGDGVRYIAHFDFDGTLWNFTRGYSLVFRPCPEWAQG